ncbi:hypothetical protein [Variovorax sp. YR752]|uniref:glycine-rich domain-containing protein n=1 Tax=Variovorax sp. YR752 TaxID=1884383 RepID=UPI003137C161
MSWNVGGVFTLLVVGMSSFALYRVWRALTARRLVKAHPFPPYLRDKLRATYPQITPVQAIEVERGLRQFFLASAMAQGRFVAMPSKVVDAMWHEFILHTRAYDVFCRKTFGRMLHHTPAEALAEQPDRADRNFQGLRRAWVWSCRDEGIDPRQPQRLPVLFALDAALAIPGGYRYVPDCRLLGADRGDTHCAGGFGCGSSCGSSSGSDGSGCGSDGGGGGCGGGGD